MPVGRSACVSTRRLQVKPASGMLKRVLTVFLRGNFFGMFDCETKIQLSDRVVCFDFHDIKDEFTKFYAMFRVLTWVKQKFVQQNREVRKKVVMDEVWSGVSEQNLS